MLPLLIASQGLALLDFHYSVRLNVTHSSGRLIGYSRYGVCAAGNKIIQYRIIQPHGYAIRLTMLQGGYSVDW